MGMSVSVLKRFYYAHKVENIGDCSGVTLLMNQHARNNNYFTTIKAFRESIHHF